jgi:hypothetical protein
MKESVRDVKAKRKNRRQHRIFKISGKWPMYLMYLAAAGLLVAGGFAFRNSHPYKESQRSQIIHAGQKLVKASLADGLRGAFGGDEETVLEPMDGNRFLVSGWIDVITDAGAQDRQNYSVILYRDASGNWTTDRVSIIPQM